MSSDEKERIFLYLDCQHDTFATAFSFHCVIKTPHAAVTAGSDTCVQDPLIVLCCFYIFSLWYPGSVKFRVVEEIHPIDNVENEKENGEHCDAVSFDFEKNFFVPKFSFNYSLLFLVFDVFSGRSTSRFHVSLNKK